MTPRSRNTLSAIVCVLLVAWSATLVILDIRGRPASREPRNAAIVRASHAAAGGIHIPDVRGMPASDARERLEEAGLKFGDARAAMGTPGRVVWTRPLTGDLVPPDTPVTIFVGVDPERYFQEPSGL